MPLHLTKGLFLSGRYSPLIWLEERVGGTYKATDPSWELQHMYYWRGTIHHNKASDCLHCVMMWDFCCMVLWALGTTYYKSPWVLTDTSKPYHSLITINEVHHANNSKYGMDTKYNILLNALLSFPIYPQSFIAIQVNDITPPGKTFHGYLLLFRSLRTYSWSLWTDDVAADQVAEFLPISIRNGDPSIWLTRHRQLHTFTVLC